jgi:DNA-binding Lrp family transcriptional regulator
MPQFWFKELVMGGANSGRGMKAFDVDAALDLLMRGESVPAIAEELGISPPTLRKRIADIQNKQGVLLQYRAIQSLQLTELQARVLEAITPEKINDAPLRDLVMSYKILKDKELNIEGKPSEIKGLVAHLIYLEKQEKALESGVEIVPGDLEDAVYSDEDKSNACKSISQLDNQDF